MSYRDPAPLWFSSFDIACLCGQNGAGKSTILEAITFALWNKARAGSDSLIYKNEQNMWVDFEFKNDHKKYRVIRKRSKKGRGTSSLDFFYFDPSNKAGAGQWLSLSGATIKETEEKMAEIIKLPYEIFVNSSYLRQGHADEFSKKAPAERKEILGKILGLDFYENVSQKAREKSKLNITKEESLSASIMEMQENLKQKKPFMSELKRAKKTLSANETLLKNEEKILQKIQSKKQKFDLITQKKAQIDHQLEIIGKEGKEMKFEAEKLENEITNINKLLLKQPQIEKEYLTLQKLRKENEQCNQKLSLLASYKERLGIFKEKEKELYFKINKIKKISTCPICLRVLTPKEAQEIISLLQKKFRHQTATKLNQIKQKISDLNYDENKHQKIRQEIEAKSDYEKDKKRLDISKRLLSEKENQLQKTKQNLAKKRIEYQRLIKERDLTEKEQKTLLPIKEKYQHQESKVGGLRQNLLEAKEVYGAFSQRILDLEKQEELCKIKKEQLIKMQQKTLIYKQLVEIFSKKGLQTMIIETVLPEIEQEANKILDKITGGRMSLSFLTQKERKTGEGEIETLDIKIADGFGERDYSLYSGGEAFRIDLAIRVALSKVLSKRAGTNLQFLAIDEGFGALDQSGKDDVAGAIMALKGDFEKILVVTHIDELKNLFNTKIEVEKDENCSHIEIVNV